MVATRLMTAEELFELPDDWGHCELIAGERIEVSPAGSMHGRIAGDITVVIALYLHQNPVARLYGGDTGFVVERSPDTVLAPDVAVVRPEDAVLDVRGFAPFPPLLAVEMKSPSNSESEIAQRLAMYLKAGVQEVWWVRPEQQSLTVHWLDRAPETFRAPELFTESVVLSGLSLDLGELFAG